MRCKQGSQSRDAASEQHVTDFFGINGANVGVCGVAADLFQGTGNTFGLPRELYSGCIGEKLALPRDGCFNQSCKEQPDPAKDRETKTNNHDYRRVLVPPAGRQPGVITATQYEPADDAKYHDAEQHAHHANVQPHVTVKDVTEFVRDNSLQLVTVEGFQCSARHRNGCVAGSKTGGKRIDAHLLFQNIDIRNRHARGDGHFLDDVSQASPQWVLNVCRNQGAAHIEGNSTAAR